MFKKILFDPITTDLMPPFLEASSVTNIVDCINLGCINFSIIVYTYIASGVFVQQTQSDCYPRLY
ncbi:hypothetical protein BDV38DRAFT_265351 [Aspergillus pseudotamarii]|uniref:Uncharacterized protein n=1 Tax=Aspergillus pseudotamarii TaxID=132259 RepID=A0A5N6SCM0_ASPPS|nr:uncharacterized protein BDV38DRAFT_265351 [Aspergillus pseudotamarii]KAE8131133.1 hypothetical protein BDV38DRAFT_265351 [Aspergillus pseudotamarii]